MITYIVKIHIINLLKTTFKNPEINFVAVASICFGTNIFNIPPEKTTKLIIIIL